MHDTAYNAAIKNNFVLTLGGDHSIAAGSISGIVKARGKIAVVWVDAHSDVNTPEISKSRN